ncbi:MAG: hypothetical protein LBE35_02140 [Clostridiales bacterium]|nr:hypothetical protein [Clostridiales bacterium]
MNQVAKLCNTSKMVSRQSAEKFALSSHMLPKTHL